MNAFDQKIKDTVDYPLKAVSIETLQVNMGYKCNLACTHCHVEASPGRNEEMPAETVDTLIEIVKNHDEIATVDITGGSPEYNPNYRRLIKTAADMGKDVLVRSNLAILSEPGMEDIPEFWAENKVKVIVSLPCYTKEGVDAQRVKGTFKKALWALKRLNVLGYGREGSGLEIDIMFNPAKEGIAPDQKMLEGTYKQKLEEMHGVVFNRLIALSNMPIGRLGKSISEIEKEKYFTELEEKFNPETLKNVMCRHLVNISPDGKIYDCDFWQMLNIPVSNGNRDVENFDFYALKNREIVTHRFCFLCTAGTGTSCSGSLT